MLSIWNFCPNFQKNITIVEFFITFVGQTVRIMKDLLLKLLIQIITEVLQDLLDDLKINGSSKIREISKKIE
jgi:hypothetical protein